MLVEKDNMVSIHYNLKLDSGETVDSSRSNNQPLEFLFGYESIIPALEKVMSGMKVGEKTTAKISAEEGYGLRDEKLIQSIPVSQMPQDIELEEGMILSGSNPNGEKFQVIVKSFDENSVEIDMNHPLAGENLNFEVEIMQIRKASEEEINQYRKN
jgi:FKBP-type peptidyl-prolyl cis-trans isomerase 2